MTRAAVVALVLFSSVRARAGGNELKAQLLCGTYVDGKVVTPLPSKKKPKLTDPVACALAIGDLEGGDAYVGTIKTVRYVVDPATGKKSKVAGQSTQGTIEQGDDGKITDVEIVFQPNDKDGDGNVAFAPCEDFDVIGEVYAAGGTFYNKTVHIAQVCPRPKPLKATVSCVAHRDDGSTFALPDRHKPRLTGITGISCGIASKDDRLFGDITVTGQTHWRQSDGAGGQADHASDPRQGVAQEPNPGPSYEIDFQPGDWDECVDVDALIEIKDADGASLFAKHLAWKQDCPD